MFVGATAFNQPLPWITSKVEDIENMFAGATDFDQPLPWNTENVENMQGTFSGATSFNQPLMWNTSKVNNMGGMFREATSFNKALQFNTSNVKIMQRMFNDAIAFNQPLSHLDTSQVTTMEGMFQGARAFNQSLSHLDTSNVETMAGMFEKASKFNQPLNNWDTSNVKDMVGMFAEAFTFNQPLPWVTSKVEDMRGMFNDAISFNQPLSHLDTSQVTTMEGMFAGASAFNQPLHNWDMKKVANKEMMFYEAPLMRKRYPDGELLPPRPIEASVAIRAGDRWKWQGLCDDRNFTLDELRKWADEFNIPLLDPNTNRMKTKKSLCSDLYLWWRRQSAKKFAVIERGCSNEYGLSGDKVARIPSEFFYPYTDGDGELVYCEDIRWLYKLVNDYSKPQNPYNRKPFTDELVEEINTSYDRLRKRAVHVEDFASSPVLSFTERFTQKLADLMGLLYHPVGLERLQHASDDHFEYFLRVLQYEYVLKVKECAQVRNESNLNNKTYLLAEILERKIKQEMNDHEGSPSAIAWATTAVYNQIFADEMYDKDGGPSKIAITRFTWQTEVTDDDEDEGLLESTDNM
jgi:surface protein